MEWKGHLKLKKIKEVGPAAWFGIKQTQAMKYGLELESIVVKELKEVTGPQVINVVR